MALNKQGKECALALSWQQCGAGLMVVVTLAILFSWPCGSVQLFAEEFQQLEPLKVSDNGRFL